MQCEAGSEHGGHGLAGIIVDLWDNQGAWVLWLLLLVVIG
jgi:hypothetical protein